MNKEKYDKYKRTIKALRSVTDEYNEITDRTKHPNADKFNIGWETNNNRGFSAFTVKLSFCNYVGYYGNSSCSVAVHLGDEELVTAALRQWLNDHRQEVFDGMADYLEKESEASRAEAIAELEEQLSQLRDGK
jgi:hypothetical protein